MNRLLGAAGLVTLAAAWLGPLPELARESVAAHMILHVSVVAVAAPLIGVSLADAAALRRLGPLLAPVPASLFEFLVVWGWHAPWLHQLARQSTGALVAEQFSFFASGFLLWAAAFRHRSAPGGGILALLLTSMHMILLGTLLTLAPRLLYHQPAGAGTEALLADQQVGGILMLAGGGIPYLIGGLLLTWRLLQPPRAASPGSESSGLLR